MSSKTWSLAKDQVLRGPLAYLGLIELSPFSPHVHRRQVCSTLVLIAPPFLVSEPQMTTENYIVSLSLTWTKFETADAWLESTIFSTTFRRFRSQPLLAFSTLQWKTTKTDIPELLQSKFVAVPLKLLMVLHFFPTKKMVPRVSRSVHGHGWSFASHRRSFGGRFTLSSR